MNRALHALELAPETVQQRFAWARRQGQPFWLWPDLRVERWRDALGQIEAVFQSALSAPGDRATLDGDEEALGIAGYTSGTGPLLGWWIKQDAIAAPPAVAELFALHLEHNQLRMRRMTHEAVQLAQLLSGAGIEATVLKGMHTAHAYFPEPATRPASDIDLLVPAYAEDRAGEVLRSAGYLPGPCTPMPKARNWTRSGVASQPLSLAFVHADDPWSVDLQTTLNRRYSPGAPIVPLDEAYAESTPEPWPVARDAKVLTQPLLLLHLAVHACCGLSNLSLLRLVEIIFVIRRDTTCGLLIWSEFLAMAGRVGATGLIYPALKLCDALSPGIVPDAVLAATRVHVPASARRVIDPLAPADAQSLTRCSLSERFMWTGSLKWKARQLAVDLVPDSGSIRELASIYASRAWRLARGTVTW